MLERFPHLLCNDIFLLKSIIVQLFERKRKKKVNLFEGKKSGCEYVYKNHNVFWNRIFFLISSQRIFIFSIPFAHMHFKLYGYSQKRIVERIQEETFGIAILKFLDLYSVFENICFQLLMYEKYFMIGFLRYCNRK